jgi:hypothetical protein
MNASFYPCLVACAALVTFGGYHLTIGRLIRKFVGNRFGVEINRRDQITSSDLSQVKVARVWIVYWGLYWSGLFVVIVVGAVLIVGIASVVIVLSHQT